MTCKGGHHEFKEHCNSIPGKNPKQRQGRVRVNVGDPNDCTGPSRFLADLKKAHQNVKELNFPDEEGAKQ
jgi:hypothetical protein